MKIKLYLLNAIACSSILLCGCSQYYYELGSSLSPDRIPQPSAEIHVADALLEFGPPARISALPTGYVLAWEYWEIEENKVGFSLGFAGADAMSVDWGKAKTRGDFLIMAFDQSHQLVDSGFTEWDNEAGQGRAVQPLGGFMSVVDVDDLLKRMPQHRWGAGSLTRLPVSLNVDSEPDRGQSGIEQRGTPTGVGQRTLEMD